MVEVMIGLGLITVAILAVFQLFPVTDKAVSLADRTAQANQLARRLLEEELDKNYPEVSARNGNVTIQHTLRRGNVLSTDFVYGVEVVESAPPTRLKDITVEVEWTHGAVTRTVRLQSLKGPLW